MGRPGVSRASGYLLLCGAVGSVALCNEGALCYTDPELDGSCNSDNADYVKMFFHVVLFTDILGNAYVSLFFTCGQNPQLSQQALSAYAQSVSIRMLTGVEHVYKNPIIKSLISLLYKCFLFLSPL